MVIDGVFKTLEERFLHPEYDFYCDYAMPFDSPEYPTREEIDAGQPAPTGWMSGLEDGALNNGINLDGVVLGYQVTGDEKYVTRGRRLIDGLLKLCTCGAKGFIARCVWLDGKTHYPYSSIDQYTMAVYGLWKVFDSGIPSSKQKTAIASVLADVADKFYAENGEILADNGRPEKDYTGGGVRGKFPSIERTLEIYKAAHFVTGESRFLDYYYEWIDDGINPSVKELLNNAVFQEDTHPYCFHQTAMALLVLVETEQDESLKTAYQGMLDRIGDICLPYLKYYDACSEAAISMHSKYGWRHHFNSWGQPKTFAEISAMCYAFYYWNPGIFMDYQTMSIPIQAAYMILLSKKDIPEEAQEYIRRIASTLPYELGKVCHSLSMFEGMYYRAKIRGVIL